MHPRGWYLRIAPGAPRSAHLYKGPSSTTAPGTGGGQNSAHLSTSCEMWVAQKFATYGAAKTGWVYEIYAPGGIDVNATARRNGYQSPYLWNKEIDFPGGVDGRYIKGACKYHLTYTNPDTKISTYENLGCKSNATFAPYKTEAPAA
ncbi:scabin-related ADP-ribosyltransferase [Streptomyces diastatochromogenes]|uniref:scabin-related ADP-ribosyltransferase n=1 Tax=Streptomyces diastatochromogenes TaxID=42236 RepID=UPI0036C834B2